MRHVGRPPRNPHRSGLPVHFLRRGEVDVRRARRARRLLLDCCGEDRRLRPHGLRKRPAQAGLARRRDARGARDGADRRLGGAEPVRRSHRARRAAAGRLPAQLAPRPARAHQHERRPPRRPAARRAAAARRGGRQLGVGASPSAAPAGSLARLRQAGGGRGAAGQPCGERVAVGRRADPRPRRAGGRLVGAARRWAVRVPAACAPNGGERYGRDV
mmetsp:Transcript_23269/g.57752  ORF Transcript_23269/g.57752 Transcript_23269/m.57752 type:complete len:216 (-) Transcript_23269:660-1307(-)